MFLTIAAGVVLILCFMSAVNYFFQKQKYKYVTDDIVKKLPFFEAPSTWSFFTIILAFLLIFFICLSIGNVGKALNDFSNQKNTINEYQQDSTSTTTDDDTSSTSNTDTQQTTK